MQVSLTAAFGLIALLFLAFGTYVYLITRYFVLDTDPDEIHFVRAPDGVKLSLHRYRPKGGATYREPVIMCHGLAMNRYLYDFGGNPALARDLRDSGFDAWIVEYRGAGMSSHPRLFDKQKADWNLDDIIQNDVPTFIR